MTRRHRSHQRARAGGARGLSAGALLAAAIAACSPAPVASQPASASSSAPAASGAGAPVAAAGGDLHAPRPLRGEPPGGSPRRKDPRWQRALAGDPLDLRALAQAEGATGLLEGVEDGGELFRAACEAIPLADDAEIALGRLGEIALLDDEALSAAAVVAIRRVAGSRPSRGEALDPDGVAYAARAVLSLSARTGLARERRARAISAARAFAERGVLDVASIPSDLDPAPADAP